MPQTGNLWTPALMLLLASSFCGCHETPQSVGAARPDQRESHSSGPRDRVPEHEQQTQSQETRFEDWHASAKLGGHNSVIQSVVFSPDGRRLFSGAADGQIKVWDVGSLRETTIVVAYSGDDVQLRALAVSPDGKLLVSASMGPSTKIKLWDTQSLELQTTFSYPGPVYCLTFSPDSKLVFAAGEHAVHVWRLRDEKLQQKLDVDMIPIDDIVLSPDGKVLYTSGYPHVGEFFARTGVVRAWDWITGTQRGEIEFAHPASGLALSPDGSKLTVAACALHLFDVTNDESSTSFQERFSKLEQRKQSSVDVFQEQFDQTAVNPVYPLVAGAAGSPGPLAPNAGHVKLFDHQGNMIARLQTERPSNAAAKSGQYDVGTVTFSPDGNLLAAGGDEGVVTLWAKGAADNAADRSTQSATPAESQIAQRERASAENNRPRPYISPLPDDASAPARAFWNVYREYRLIDWAFQCVLPDLRNLQSKEQQRIVFESMAPDVAEFGERLLTIARDAPRDEVAVDSLAMGLYLCRNPHSERERDLRKEIIGELSKTHFADPELSRVCYMLERLRSVAAEKLMKRACQSHPNPNVRAHACYSLARYYHDWSDDVRAYRQDANRKEWAQRMFDDDIVKMYETTDPERLESRAEQLYEQVVNEYAKILRRPGTYSRLDTTQREQLPKETLGELAQRGLKCLRQLAIGEPAPEIQGEDIEGVSFKLSDYRGRVVALVFSSNWCGPCRQMYEHERKLVEQLKDQPFALLHVNSDFNRQEVKRLKNKGKITWRCWWDGPGADGPISTQWNIDARPAVYVLNAKGTIRYRNVRSKALTEAVESLLSELKESENAVDASQ